MPGCKNYNAVMKKAFQRHYEEKSDVWTTDIGMRVLPLLVEGKVLLKKGYSVLDIGCGSGSDAIIYSSLCGTVTGIDIYSHPEWSAIMAHNSNITFHCADFINFTPDTNYHVVVDNGCLHHQTLEQIPVYLKKIKQLLAQDGYFVVSTFYDPATDTYTDGYNRIHHYFNMEELESLFLNSGLSLVDTIMIYRPRCQNYYRISFCQNAVVK